MMKIKNDEKKISDGLKALFVVVGAIVTIGTIALVLYNVFKKYFKITVECEGDDEDYFDDFDEYDPVCSPEDCASCGKAGEEDDEEEDEDEDEDDE